MIKSISQVKDFKAVPYLEASMLNQNHHDGLVFSTEKPNVIVGPNGAGKSALLAALALKTLSFYIGESALDDNFVSGLEADDYWTEISRWGHEYAYLQGLTCETDNAPALYYRPSHIPGNEADVAHALFQGYSEQARNYSTLASNKSSGQQSQALLNQVQALLKGEATWLSYQYVNWRYGKEPRKPDSRYCSKYDDRAECLKKLYRRVEPGAVPLVLMDEPEQSLDAKAEALLWRQIAQVDASKVQVIVATHSLYPLLHPEAFNLLEAVPGYAQEVRALL